MRKRGAEWTVSHVRACEDEEEFFFVNIFIARRKGNCDGIYISEISCRSIRALRLALFRLRELGWITHRTGRLSSASLFRIAVHASTCLH